jgi:hypothetical protein
LQSMPSVANATRQAHYKIYCCLFAVTGAKETHYSSQQ